MFDYGVNAPVRQLGRPNSVIDPKVYTIETVAITTLATSSADISPGVYLNLLSLLEDR